MANTLSIKSLLWTIIALALSNAGLGFCCFYNAIRIDILENASHFHIFLFIYIVASLLIAIYSVIWLTRKPASVRKNLHRL